LVAFRGGFIGQYVEVDRILVQIVVLIVVNVIVDGRDFLQLLAAVDRVSSRHRAVVLSTHICTFMHTLLLLLILFANASRKQTAIHVEQDREAQ